MVSGFDCRVSLNRSLREHRCITIQELQANVLIAGSDQGSFPAQESSDEGRHLNIYDMTGDSVSAMTGVVLRMVVVIKATHTSIAAIFPFMN